MRKSGSVRVKDLPIHYDVEGDGPPLLLLHGGFMTAESSFAKLRPALSQRRTTIAIEQQAHGHTPDSGRPLSYERMVEDTAAVLRSLGHMEIDVFGWSDGGIVGLGLGLGYPELVRKVAIFGAGFNTDAEGPEFKKLMAALTPEDLPPHFSEAYAKVAPDPHGFPSLVEKVKAMYAAFPGWDRKELRKLKTPLLVMLGDHDFVSVDHALELFRLVPDARLAVLPGTDHSGPLTRADWLAPMLLDFFDQ